MPKTATHGALIGLTMSLIASIFALIALISGAEFSAIRLLMGAGAIIVAITGGGILSMVMAWLNRFAPAWLILGGLGALSGALGLGMLHGGRGLFVWVRVGGDGWGDDESFI